MNIQLSQALSDVSGATGQAVIRAVVAWVFASQAAQNYWQMVSDLGYVECMPDYQGCAPLTGNETPWWVLFFSL